MNRHLNWEYQPMYTTPSWWPLLSSQRVRMAGTGKSVNSVSGRRSHQVASAERAQELTEWTETFQPAAMLDAHFGHFRLKHYLCRLHCASCTVLVPRC